MTAIEMDSWLASRKTCTLGGMELRPRAHPVLPNTPLSVVRGQAEAFYTITIDDRQWILKKFHSGKSPDGQYLRRVRDCLPKSDSFIAGSQRCVLSGIDSSSRYSSKAFATWIDGTILMPKIDGVDWSTMAD